MCCLGAGSARSPGRESVGTTFQVRFSGLWDFPTGGRGAQICGLCKWAKTRGKTTQLHLVLHRSVNHNPLWYHGSKFFLAWGLLMAENALSVLALACSIAAFATALVVAIRSTPQRVRKNASDAIQLAEEVQLGLQVIANGNVAFMEEVTRERASAAADLKEAERKRRQAAAKLSKLPGADGENPAPASLQEVLASLPVGDPRRIKALRQSHGAANDGM